MISVKLEEKIREIVLEVLKEYNKTRILVVVTGGIVNADVSIEQLKNLRGKHDLEYSLLFTRSAAKVHDIEKISRELGAESVIIDGKEEINVRGLLKQFKAVVVAVLTRNTAAKVANLFLDNLTTQVIVDAQMLGIPVIAARDAADPFIKPWQDLGFIWMGMGLKDAYREILGKIEKYGIILCRASEINHELTKVLFGIQKEETLKHSPEKRVSVNKKVITREDLTVLAGTQSEIHIPEDSIITPLAADYIRENSIKILRS